MTSTASSNAIVSSSPTSRVFNVNELLYIILNQIQTGAKPDFRTVAGCAIVSHSFCEPAVRVLWRELPGLTPVWSLLAPTSQSMFSSADHWYTSIASAKLYEDPALWTRFLAYTSHVCKFEYGTGLKYGDDSKLIATAVERNGGQSVFPKLQAVHVSRGSLSNSVNALFPVITHALRVFEVSCEALLAPYSESGLVSPALGRVHEKASDLEEISITVRSFRDEAIQDWPPTIPTLRSFVHLQRLSLPPIPNYETLRDLLMLPTLTSLRTCEVSIETFDSTGPISLITCSPSLRSLSLAYPIATMTWILNHVYAPTLTHFNLTLFGDRCAEDPFESHTTVTPPLRALAKRTLLTYQPLSLSLKITVDGGPDHFNSLPLLPVLTPLLALSELRGFALHAGECALFTASDADIASLARAWTKLEVFEIDCMAMTNVIPDLPPLGVRRAANANAGPGRPTFACVNAFHEHCPHLVRLALPLALPGHGSRVAPDASGPGYAPPPDYVSSHPLRELVGVNPYANARRGEFGEADAERWARHFLRLFPRLEVGREEEWGRGESWRMVCAAVRRIVRMRLDA